MQRVCFIFGIAILIASHAFGQIVQRNKPPRPDKWEVSFFAGYALVSDEEFVTAVIDDASGEVVSTQAIDVDFDAGPAFAFRVTDNFSRFFGAELEYAFSNHGSVFRNILPDPSPVLDVDQRLHKLTYSALVYPLGREGRIIPFGLAGAGATYFQVSTNQDELALTNRVDLRNRWKFAFTYGGGLKFRVDEKWAIRFDARNQVTQVPDYGLPREIRISADSFSPGFRSEGSFQNWQFGAGLTYYLNIR